MPDQDGFISDEEMAAMNHAAGPDDDGFISDDELLKQRIAPEEAPGYLNSAASGALQGASFGFSDEILGGIKGGYGALMGEGNYGDLYKQNRDQERQRLKIAQETNPKMYGTGELLGAVAPAFIPGGQAALAGRLGASAARTVAGSALGAGVQALGTSEEENLNGMAKDFAGGAAFGAAVPLGGMALKGVASKAANTNLGRAVIGGAEKGLNYAKSKLPDLGIKTTALLTGADEGKMREYLKNPQGVNIARPIDELASDVNSGVERLKDKVILGSRDATEKIPEALRIPREEISSEIDRIKGAMGEAYTDKDASALKELTRLQKRVLPESGGAPLEGKEIKRFVKKLDRVIDHEEQAGEFMTPAHIAKNDLRRFLDGKLKEEDLYREAMVPVAADAQALELASKQFPSVDVTAGRLKSAATRPEYKQEVTGALSAMDERLGTNYVDENNNRALKQYFEQDMTGGRGPRNRVVGGVIGGLAGMAMGGPVGGMLGLSGGLKAGQYLDKYGNKVAKNALDMFIDGSGNLMTQKLRTAANRAGKQGDALRQLIKQNPELMGGVLGVAAENSRRKSNYDYSGSEE